MTRSLRLNKPIRFIASREYRKLFTSLQGIGVWVILVLTYGLAINRAYEFNVLAQFATVDRALAAMNALDLFLIPLAGLLLGYDAIAGELELGTSLFLASKPISRRVIVFGKSIGRVGYLITVWITVTIGSMTWIGWKISKLRNSAGESLDPAAILGRLEGAVLYPISLLTLAMCFLGLGIMVSALVRRKSAALSIGFAVYGILGIAWNSLFSLGQQPEKKILFAKLASPFVAWLEWSNQLLGKPSPWISSLTENDIAPFVARSEFLVGIILIWFGGSVALAAWRFSRRDLPR